LKNRFKFKPLDFILLIAIILSVAYVVIKMKTDLHYKWDWSSTLSYIIRYDSINDSYVPGLLISGLIVTFKLSVWATVFASIIGLVMGLIRIYAGAALRLTSLLYVALVRNIPSIVFIFIFYFFISGQIADAFSLNSLSSESSRYAGVIAFLF